MRDEEHLRAIIEFFDLQRLTKPVRLYILSTSDIKLPHVDSKLERILKEAQK